MQHMLKSFVFALGLILGLSACRANTETSSQGQTANDPNKPWNVVFILADDLAWNQVGYNGTDFYETPNIDAIARSGIQFTRAYSASPVCSPSRASIMTGKSPARLHITDYIPGSPYPYALLNRANAVPPLPLEEITIAEMMKDKGYVTGSFGKWHLSIDKNYQPGRAGDPGSQGFDEVLTTVKPEYDADPFSDPHHTAEITDRALDFLDRHKDEPFFLYMAYHTVHRPLIERPDNIAKYSAKDNVLEPVNNPIMGAMIETMDNGIGKVLDRLDQYNLTNNTIIIFYSDNGGLEQLQSQYPFRGGKAMVWEGGLRVPMAIKWPGVVKAGQVSRELVTSDDFFPTFKDILQWNNNPQTLDGISLLPILNGSEHKSRDALYFHFPHYHHLGYKPAGAVRRGDYKLIEWFDGTIGGVGKKYSLYNVETDFDESDDLSTELPQLTEELAAQLKAWRAEVGAKEMTVNKNFELKRSDWRFEDRHGGDSK